MTSDIPDYKAISPKSGKHPSDYSYVERRSEIYRLIEEAGHPHNLERSQQELADRYGVSQRQISKDIQKLREYESEHNDSRTRAVTSWLAEKSVMSAVEKGDFEEAFNLQLKYNEFLFQIGDLDRESTSISIEGDAGNAYMEMLREAHQQQKEKELSGSGSKAGEDE